MLRTFKPTRWSVVLWVVLFLLFPLPYKGACVAMIGAYCPSWTFFGGLNYAVEFFDMPLVLLPGILSALVVSFILAHVIFGVVRKIKAK